MSKRKKLCVQSNSGIEDIIHNLGKTFEIGRKFIWVISIILFCVEYYLENNQGMFLTIMVLFFTNLCFSLSKFSGRMAYTLFLASFFCFILGRMTVEFISSHFVNFNFEDDISKHMLLTIFLSLLFLQLGVLISNTYQTKIKNRYMKEKKDTKQQKGNIEWLRFYAKILFFASAICSISMNLEQILFIQQYSYVDLYIKFSSNIPWIIQIIGNMYLPLFMIFVATCPAKRTCVLPIILFIFISITILGAGDRGTFVTNIAVLIAYIFWRQYHDKETWISNKIIFLGIICLPFVFAGLSFWVYFREGIDVGEHSVLAQFTRFFRRAGMSVDLLGYGKEFQSQFSQSMYSFGEVIDYIKYNPITEAIFGTVKPKQYTVEYATTMHSYSHAISYFIFPDQYLLGHGKGSCYMAEIYQDFGYTGIIFWNIFYGVFLTWFELDKKFQSPYTVAILFMMLRAMFYIPRGPAIYPISSILNVTSIFVLFSLYFIVNLRTKS